MDEDDTLIREMGCTDADFLRWLPGATGNAPVATSKNAAGTLHRITLSDGMVEILVRPEVPRRIASIVLPVLRVTIRFIGLDGTQRAAFLDTFDRYTHRGGG